MAILLPIYWRAFRGKISWLSSGGSGNKIGGFNDCGLGLAFSVGDVSTGSPTSGSKAGTGISGAIAGRIVLAASSDSLYSPIDAKVSVD